MSTFLVSHNNMWIGGAPTHKLCLTWDNSNFGYILLAEPKAMYWLTTPGGMSNPLLASELHGVPVFTCCGVAGTTAVCCLGKGNICLWSEGLSWCTWAANHTSTYGNTIMIEKTYQCQHSKIFQVGKKHKKFRLYNGKLVFCLLGEKYDIAGMDVLIWKNWITHILCKHIPWHAALLGSLSEKLRDLAIAWLALYLAEVTLDLAEVVEWLLDRILVLALCLSKNWGMAGVFPGAEMKQKFGLGNKNAKSVSWMISVWWQLTDKAVSHWYQDLQLLLQTSQVSIEPIFSHFPQARRNPPMKVMHKTTRANLM